MISAPRTVSTRADSGNSLSQQIIMPTLTGPLRVSNSTTPKPSPGTSAASIPKSQVCTFE